MSSILANPTEIVAMLKQLDNQQQQALSGFTRLEPDEEDDPIFSRGVGFRDNLANRDLMKMIREESRRSGFSDPHIRFRGETR